MIFNRRHYEEGKKIANDTILQLLKHLTAINGKQTQSQDGEEVIVKVKRQNLKSWSKTNNINFLPDSENSLGADGT